MRGFAPLAYDREARSTTDIDPLPSDEQM